MNKRAAFPIAIILGLIVILLVGYGVVTVGWNYAKEKFFDERGVFGIGGPSEEEFVPYAGPALTDEEKTVLDSMNALVCAVSSIGAGRPGWDDPKICPVEGLEILKPRPSQIAQATTNAVAITGMQTAEEEKKESKTRDCIGDIAYGKTCVSCFESKSGLRPVSLGAKAESIQLLVDETLRCWNKLKENDYDNVYCTSVLPTDLKESISEDEYLEALAESGDLGDDIVGGVIDPSNFQWKIRDPLTSATKQFYLCADNAGINDIMLTHDKNDCPLDKSAFEENKFECTIKSFELPQKISFTEEWITGSGDPKYLAYFEKFPIGEDKAWQFDAKNFMSFGLMVRGVLTILPFSGGLIKLRGDPVKKIVKLSKGLNSLPAAQRQARLIKIGKELKKLDKAGILDEGLEALIRTDINGEFAVHAQKALDDIGNQMFSSINRARYNSKHFNANPATTKIDDAGVSIADGTFTAAGTTAIRNDIRRIAQEANIPIKDSQIDEFVEIATKRDVTPNDIVTSLSRGGADESIRSSLIAARRVGQLSDFGQLAKKVGFSNLVKTIVKRGNLEKEMTKAVKGLSALKKTNPAKYDQVIKEADDLAKTFIDDTGRIDFKALMDDTSESALASLLRTTDDAGAAATRYGVQVTAMRDLLSGKNIGKGLWAGSIQAATGPLPQGTNMRMFWEFIKNQARGLGCVVPAAVGVGIASADAGTVGTTAAVAGASLLTGPACLRFVRDHAYPILLGIGILTAMEDSRNQKFIPVGKNNFGLVTPLSGDVAYKKTFEAFEIDKYYVEMHKGDESRQRFFAASPCKIDYDVTPSYNSCAILHNNYFYEFTDLKGNKREQVIDPIGGDAEALSVWDDLSARQKDTLLFYGGSQQLWPGRAPVTAPQIGPEILSIMNEDPIFYIDLFEILWADANSLLHTFSKLRAPKLHEKLQPITQLSNEQFLDFRDDFLIFTSTRGTNFEYNKHGINIKFEGLELIDNFYHPLTDYVYSSTTLSRPWTQKDYCTVDIYDGEGRIPCPWKNTDKPWAERTPDWSVLLDTQGNLKIIPNDFHSMQTHKLYNTKWFEDFAKYQMSVTRYHYKGPTDMAVKHCPESSKVAPTPENRNRFEMTTTIPTSAIIPGKPDSNYNEGNNYCYSNVNKDLITFGDFIDGIALGLAVFSLGVGNPTLFVTLTAVDVGGFVIAFALEKCGDWPKHEVTLNPLDCF